jgi:Mitochondrial carrier protein
VSNCALHKTLQQVSYEFFLYLLILQTGAIAITVANPTDLVKVRLQSEGKLSSGSKKRYSGALNAYATIIKQVCHFHNSWNVFQVCCFCLNFDIIAFRKDWGLCGLGLDQTLLGMP